MKKIIPAVLALALGGALFAVSKNFNTCGSSCENTDAAPVQVAGGGGNSDGK